MSDYINRHDLLNKLHNIRFCGRDAFVVYDEILRAPTVAMHPIRQGEWEWSENASKWKCSNCWHTVEEEDANTEYEFCPYCGARMDGKRR